MTLLSGLLLASVTPTLRAQTRTSDGTTFTYLNQKQNNKVSLTLTPTSSFGINPADDIPKQHVSVILPLHSRAQSTHLKAAAIPLSTPSSPYLVTADAKYLVPGSPQTLGRWYESVLPKVGLKFFGSSSSGNSNRGPNGSAIMYQGPKNKNLLITVVGIHRNHGQVSTQPLRHSPSALVGATFPCT